MTAEKTIVSRSGFPASAGAAAGARERETIIRLEDATLPALLTLPAEPVGIVAFAHGSGSSRLSPRNRVVASSLTEAAFATLLFDLLTPLESRERRNVFDVRLLARRLEAATRWMMIQPEARGLPVGYFGASTGAAAALWAAADLGPGVKAIVSRGGRPDLAAARLGGVTAPTLLLVGALDTAVLELNRSALTLLECEAELRVVPGATHLFQEPGALERVAGLGRDWFARHLGGRP